MSTSRLHLTVVVSLKLPPLAKRDRRGVHEDYSRDATLWEIEDEGHKCT